MKSIEQLKGSLKEFGTTIDESHMDQVILNSKYRQINEKVELLMSCKV